jgi:hypothetical protein
VTDIILDIEGSQTHLHNVWLTDYDIGSYYAGSPIMTLLSKTLEYAPSVYRRNHNVVTVTGADLHRSGEETRIHNWRQEHSVRFRVKERTRASIPTLKLIFSNENDAILAMLALA